MVVDHAGGLHEGITDGTADEFESALFQIPAHGVAFGRGHRDLRKCFPSVLDGCAADKGPEVFAERSKFLTNLQINAGVQSHRINLEPIADDSRVLQNFFKLLVGQSGQFFRIELFEYFPVILPPVEDDFP